MSMPRIMGKGFSSTHCPRLPADFGNNFRGGTANLSPEMAPKDLRLGTPVVPPFSQAGPYSSRERQGPQCPCAQGNEKGWDSLGMSQGRLRNALFPRDCYRELFFPQMQHARVCFQKEKQNKNKTKTTLTIFFCCCFAELQSAQHQAQPLQGQCQGQLPLETPRLQVTMIRKVGSAPR